MPDNRFSLTRIFLHKERILRSVFIRENTGQSNTTHPPSILRQILLSIETCLSKHSSNKKIFKESTQIYQEALKKSGYKHQLTYQQSINNKNEETKLRKRKIILFNPQYSKKIFNGSRKLIPKIN